MFAICKTCRADEEEEVLVGDEADPRAWQRGVSTVEMQSMQVPVRKRDPRTTHDDPATAQEALEALKLGNQRFAESLGPLVRAPLGSRGRGLLVDQGQRPGAIILGCADSRVPSDTIFDAQPGDLFILRNAGNCLVKAEHSVVGSMEYAVAHLKSKLILVLGHTKCGAIAGATGVMLAKKANPTKPVGDSALEVLLDGLTPVAEMTAAQLPIGTPEAEIAAKAVKTNVFHTMANIMAYSTIIRDAVKSGDVMIHGGVYDLASGKVEFLGQHPQQAQKLAAGGSINQLAMGA